MIPLDWQSVWLSLLIVAAPVGTCIGFILAMMFQGEEVENDQSLETVGTNETIVENTTGTDILTLLLEVEPAENDASRWKFAFIVIIFT